MIELTFSDLCMKGVSSEQCICVCSNQNGRLGVIRVHGLSGYPVYRYKSHLRETLDGRQGSARSNGDWPA